MSTQSSNKSTIKERSKVSALKVYKDYLALKAHFRNDNYDYFLNNGKTRCSAASFERRSDKYFFEKLAKKKDYFEYLLSNIAYDDSWIGDITLNEKAKENYITFCKRKQSFTYFFKEQLKLLNPELQKNFIIEDAHPYILQLYVEGTISLEVISILAKITGAGKYWDQHLKDDVLWSLYRNKILKYERFLSYDKDKIKQLMRSI